LGGPAPVALFVFDVARNEVGIEVVGIEGDDIDNDLVSDCAVVVVLVAGAKVARSNAPRNLLFLFLSIRINAIAAVIAIIIKGICSEGTLID
jgi:hypothetical protein